MNKIRIVLMISLFSFVLAGCGTKADAVSQKMIDDINSIGEVTINDEETVNRLIERYSTLTDAQKSSVNNYDKLLNAQDKIIEMKKDAQNVIQEKLNDPSYKYAINFCKKIKKNLNNPDSFILKEVICSDFDDGDSPCINYELVYTGENKMVVELKQYHSAIMSLVKIYTQ